MIIKSISLNDLSSYNDILLIVNQLNNQERHFIGDGYLNNPGILIRKIVYSNDDIPVAFIQVYQDNKFFNINNMDDSVISICLAVIKSYRRRHIATKLLKSIVKWFNDNTQYDYHTLQYYVDGDNIDSIRLASSLNFKLKESFKSTHSQLEYLYIMTK